MPMSWFLGFTISLIVLIGLLAVTFWTTPAAAFLKARLKRSNLILLATRTGKILPIVGKYRTGTGMVETKNHGMYLMLPESNYMMAGVTVGIAYEDSGVTLPEDYVKATNVLRDEGVLPESVVEPLERGVDSEKIAEDIEKEQAEGDSDV